MNKYLEIIKKQQELIELLLSLDKKDISSITSPVETATAEESFEILSNSVEVPDISENRTKEFLQSLKNKGKSENTIECYEVALKKYYEIYDSISVENLSTWEKELKKHFSAKTVNNRIIAMRAYLNFIGFEGYEFSKLKEQKKGFCDNAINEEQYEKLIKWAKNKNIQTYKIARIIAATGVRVSELVELKTSDMEKGYVDITSKANKNRRIYFPETLVKDIREYCTGEYLIMNRFGLPMTTRGVSSNLARAGEKAGIAKEVMHPHSFRHFFAKQFLKQNNDITLLGDLLGHSDITTTAIYTRKTSKEQQSEINKIVNW